MKILYCTKCKSKVGEMSKGKIMKGVEISCPRCNSLHSAEELKKAAEDLSKIGNKSSGFDVEDYFGSIFKS